MRFEVFIGDALIGETNLEHRDPPMGVALGALRLAECESLASDLRLGTSPRPVVVREKGGERRVLPSDAMMEGSSLEDLEVSVLGVPYEIYREWFPDA